MLKYALLALIAREPRHGYDLKSAFEEAMGGTWPLNIGQIYTTLSRLERDGLVESTVVEQDVRPNRKVYRITQEGEKELDRWLAQPLALGPPLRDDLYVKMDNPGLWEFHSHVGGQTQNDNIFPGGAMTMLCYTGIDGCGSSGGHGHGGPSGDLLRWTGRELP